MNHKSDHVVGHEQTRQRLLRASKRGRLAHALLFSGPPSVGKETFALSIAREIMTHHETGNGLSALQRRLSNGSHPDLRIFSPRSEGMGTLPVATVRDEILPYCRFAPLESKCAFIILPDADVSFPPSQGEAANTLLKTLEEPRPNVHFILTSSAPGRLLSTIRSRCQPVRFRQLNAEQLQKIADTLALAPNDVIEAIPLSGGRVDRMIDLCDENKRLEILEGFRFMVQALLGKTLSPWLKFCDSYAKHEELSSVLEFGSRYFRDISAKNRKVLPASLATQCYRDADQHQSSIDTETALRCATVLLETVANVRGSSANPQLQLEAIWAKVRYEKHMKPIY